jgi:hypothetical protein
VIARVIGRPIAQPLSRKITQPGSAGTPLDADVAAWASAVTANSGTYSAPTLAAVAAFVASAKASGYWTKLNRINLFCGDQLAAALVPLKVGGGNATDTNVNFVGGDYTEATGLTGNGTTKYLRTGLIPSVSLVLNDTHMAVYNRESASAVSNQFGAGGPMIFYAPHTGAQLISDQYNSTTGRVGPTAAIGTPYGFLVASRNGAGEHVIYRNGAAVTSAATSGGALPAIECYVFASNNFGGPAAINDGARGGYSIGSGLSAADVTAYNTHMETFQDALARGVQ